MPTFLFYFEFRAVFLILSYPRGQCKDAPFSHMVRGSHSVSIAEKIEKNCEFYCEMFVIFKFSFEGFPTFCEDSAYFFLISLESYSLNCEKKVWCAHSNKYCAQWVKS